MPTTVPRSITVTRLPLVLGASFALSFTHRLPKGLGNIDIESTIGPRLLAASTLAIFSSTDSDHLPR